MGKALAANLGWSFVDTDVKIIQKEGKSIKEIVSATGWGDFRKKEKAEIKRICGLDKQVVATGGGVVLDPESVTAMKRCGKIVWLKARPETIYQRMTDDKNTTLFRPALTKKDLFKEVREMLAVRQPMYTQAKDMDVDTDGVGPTEIARRVICALDLSGKIRIPKHAGRDL